MEAKEKLNLLYQALDQKQAQEIEMIDISLISPLADYFLLCSAGNDSQMRALMDAVEECAFQNHFESRKPEGSYSSGWVLIDCGDVIVHLFSADKRDFFQLSHIWKDGKFLTTADFETEESAEHMDAAE